MYVSIVIPVYNEAGKIAADIATAQTFLDQHEMQGEVIVADDGSTDDTAQVAAAANARVVQLPHHRGKGAVLRAGIAQTHGTVVMFTDSGGCVPFEDALTGMDMLANNQCDIAHGSRRLPQSTILTPQPHRRRCLSWLFRQVAAQWFPLPPRLTDTQCGFKLYRGAVARAIYRNGFTDGFMIDIEMILRAQACGYRIKEFPIHWHCDPDSRLKPRADFRQTLRELRRIRREL